MGVMVMRTLAELNRGAYIAMAQQLYYY